LVTAPLIVPNAVFGWPKSTSIVAPQKVVTAWYWVLKPGADAKT
jgi:hypothetical protein